MGGCGCGGGTRLGWATSIGSEIQPVSSEPLKDNTSASLVSSQAAGTDRWE